MSIIERRFIRDDALRPHPNSGVTPSAVSHATEHQPMTFTRRTNSTDTTPFTTSLMQDHKVHSKEILTGQKEQQLLIFPGNVVQIVGEKPIDLADPQDPLKGPLREMLLRMTVEAQSTENPRLTTEKVIERMVVHGIEDVPSAYEIHGQLNWVRSNITSGGKQLIEGGRYGFEPGWQIISGKKLSIREAELQPESEGPSPNLGESEDQRVKSRELSSNAQRLSDIFEAHTKANGKTPLGITSAQLAKEVGVHRSRIPDLLRSLELHGIQAPPTVGSISHKDGKVLYARVKSAVSKGAGFIEIATREQLSRNKLAKIFSRIPGKTPTLKTDQKERKQALTDEITNLQKKGYSKSDIADTIGVSQGYVNTLLRGTADHKSQTADKSPSEVAHIAFARNMKNLRNEVAQESHPPLDSAA